MKSICTMSVVRRIALITFAAGFAGCKSDSISNPEPASVHEIVLTPPTAPLPAGVPTKVEAVAKDSVGNPLPGHAFSWSTSNEAIARVSSSGEVTGVTPGVATISASTEGKTGSTSVTIVVGAPATIRIVPASPDVFRNSSRQLVATVQDVMGNIVPSALIEWSSSNATQIPIESSGLIRGNGPTTAESEITASFNGLHSAVTARIPVVNTIQIGWNHGCLLTDRARTYCWGENVKGQLGIGTVTRDTLRLPVLAVSNVQFAKLSVGQLHNCGLSADGIAYCWGWNATGQIGDGSVGGDQPMAKQVSGTIRFSSISAGQNHTCGIATDGDTYCWGNGKGTPAKVQTDIRFASIAAGIDYTCGLDQNGRAWCWGANYRGELGIGTADQFGTPVPVAVSGGRVFKSIDTASWGFVCGLTPDGVVYCWGSFTWRTTPGFGPEQVPGSLRFTDISAGANQLCGLAVDRQAWCLGNGFEGQLGDGQRHEPATTVFVHVLPGTPPATGFIQIGAGESATCGVSVEGSPYCWGYWSRLGAGVDVRQTSPVLVKSP